MEDWEDVEEVGPILNKVLPKNQWDDEDLDENDVKESWEDEDEPTPAPELAPAEKSIKKSVEKPNTKKGKSVEIENQKGLDPLADKLLQQRLVEEADFKSTTELFGKKGDEKTLDTFIPKSESDFMEYAELISHKLRPYEKSFHYIGLLKSVMRLSVTSLKAADIKELGSSVMTISNEKLRAEKEANAGKKKTGAKKKQLHVDKDDDMTIMYDDKNIDDYDFM